MTTIVTRAGKGFPLTWNEVDANFNNLNNDKAELASPTFTGTPIAPTAAVNTNTTQVATTAFVNAEINSDRPYSDTNPVMDGTATQGASARVSRQDHVHPTDTSRVAKAGDTMTGTLTGTLFTAPQDQLGTSATATQNFTLDASAANGTMKLARGNAGATTQDVMTVDANGIVLFPQNKEPAFAATGSVVSLAVNVGTKVSATTEVFDTDTCYDAPNSRFTPNVAGYYQCNIAVNNQITIDTFGVYGYITKNGVTTVAQGGSTGNAATFAFGTASCVVYMNGTTDYIEGGNTLTGPSGSGNVICNYFSAALVRRA